MSKTRTASQIANSAIRGMAKLKGEKRLFVMMKIHNAFCQYCGTDHRKNAYGKCNCWNDE